MSGRGTGKSFIKQVLVSGLFGSFDYQLPESPSPAYDRLLILYGDNGAGKTTVLRLVYSLLTPISGGGNKSYVAATPFRHLQVTFNDGSSIAAEKPADALVGAFRVEIARAGKRWAGVVPVDDKGDVTDELQDFFAQLRGFSPPLYLLPDDRRVKSTQNPEGLQEPSAIRDDDIVLSAINYNRLLLNRKIERTESHHLAITPVLSALHRWMQTHVYQGSSLGEESTATIYLNIIQQLSSFGYSDDSSKSSETELIRRVAQLGLRTRELARYEMAPPFPQDKFIEAINGSPDYARQAMARVLDPYLTAQEARLNALDAIRTLIATYVGTVNSFLHGKEIQFSIQRGVQFSSKNGVIDPNWLSSGERQLVLLLSHTILARDTGGLFFIDEPELSLNIKWQRRLVEALLACAKGSDIQYVLASHSLELISQYISNAAQLRIAD